MNSECPLPHPRRCPRFLLSFWSLLRLRNLQNALPEVLTLEHAQEAVDGIIDTVGDVVDALETAVGDPLADVLVALFPPADDVGVEDQEALPAKAAAHDLRVVLDPVVVRRRLVVVRRDGAARHDPPEVVHVRDGHVQQLAPDVVVVDVDAVRRQSLQRLVVVFLFVVESRREAQVVEDEVQLFVVPY